MKYIDLPLQRIPIEFFNHICFALYRKVGDNFPFDRLKPFGLASFNGVDHSQFQIAATLFLANRWTERYHMIFIIQQFRRHIALVLVVPHLDPMYGL